MHTELQIICLNLQQRIKNIWQHITLKKLTGVLIFCVLLLSITPKQTLHSLTAHHKDESSKKITDKDKVQFNHFGLNCDCNSIVATSPFTETSVLPEIQLHSSFSFSREIHATSYTSAPFIYFSRRGPPSIA